MAMGGSVEELPWIVEEDAFGLRHSKGNGREKLC